MSLPQTLLQSLDDFETFLTPPSTKTYSSQFLKGCKRNTTGKQSVSYIAEDLVPRWSTAEKNELVAAVKRYIAENGPDNEINWAIIAKSCPQRQPMDCLMKYRNDLDSCINRNQWPREEEMRLVDLVTKYRCRFWVLVADELNTGRTPLDCLRHYQQSFGTTVICNNESWTKEEDDILMKAVLAYGEKNWQHVATALSGRNKQQCLLRYRRIAKTDKDGFWSEDEERRLFLTVISHFRSSLALGKVSTRGSDSTTAVARTVSSSSSSSEGDIASAASATSVPANTNTLVVSWTKIARQISGRQDSQCREKWARAIDPMLNASKASAEEDAKIMELVAKHGVGNWSAISQELPTRNDKFVFKRWKLLSAQGDIEAFHASSRSKRMTHFQHGRKKAKTELQPADYEASVLDPNAGKITTNIANMLSSSAAAFTSSALNTRADSDLPIATFHLGDCEVAML